MKFFLSCALAGLPLAAFCQNLTVAYNITISGRDQVQKGLLIANDSLAKFSWPLEPTFEGNVNDKKNGFLYETQRFLGMKFSVKDSLHTMKWQSGRDSQTILGYPCLSATTVFRGRPYTAYYTTKLPVADGPWKLGGLPGLILAAKSTDGYVEWKATSVTLGTVAPIDIAALRTRKNLSWQEFVPKFKQDIIRQTKYIRSKGIAPDDAKLKLKLDAEEIIYPELQTGEGLSY